MLIAARPGVALPRDFDGNMQTIAAAAHKRGVVLMRGGQAVGAVGAAELCRTLRAAHAATRDGRDLGKFEQVKQIAGALAVKIGPTGPVEVSRSVFSLLKGFAKAKKDRSSP